MATYYERRSNAVIKYYTAFDCWISVVYELFLSVKSTNDYVVT